MIQKEHLFHWVTLKIVITMLVLTGTQLSHALTMEPIDTRQVKIGGEIGRRIEITVEKNILAIDTDNVFLQPFIARGVEQEGAFIGVGKHVDAMAKLTAYTSNEKLKAFKEYLVKTLLGTQEPDGYIGLYITGKRVWTCYDLHDMSFIIIGLTSDYKHCGQQESLEAAKKLADCILAICHDDPKRRPECFGGISDLYSFLGTEEAFVGLYEQTGEKKYLDFCIEYRKIYEWPHEIVIGRWGKIDGSAYTYMCPVLAQLRLYEMEPNLNLLKKANGVVDFLTKQDGMLISGNCGYQECWHTDQRGFMKTAETCATVYLLKLFHELMQLEGKSQYGDIMERSIYNGLFAAQSPDGRKIRYYTPLEGPRQYFDPDSYCCPCNFRRAIADIPEMIYYRSSNGVAVNLYTESAATIQLDNNVTVNLQQQTDYPNSGRVKILITPSDSVEMALQLRIPKWCHDARVQINGKAAGGPIRSGDFFTMKRKWKNGDQVELEMPMSWRFVRGRKSQSGRVAVMRGPVLFCVNPDYQKMGLSEGKTAGLEPVNTNDLTAETLRYVIIDPGTLPQGPINDNSIRPGGMTCKIKAWRINNYMPIGPDMELVLTEFVDPDGQATYLLVPDASVETIVDDELILAR